MMQHSAVGTREQVLALPRRLPEREAVPGRTHRGPRLPQGRRTPPARSTSPPRPGVTDSASRPSAGVAESPTVPQKPPSNGTFHHVDRLVVAQVGGSVVVLVDTARRVLAVPVQNPSQGLELPHVGASTYRTGVAWVRSSVMATLWRVTVSGDAGLRVERDGDVEILTLDRPDAHNALTFELYDALEHAVQRPRHGVWLSPGPAGRSARATT